MKAKNLTGRNVAIKIRENDWTTVTRARTIDDQTNEAATIAATAGELLRENAPERPVRLLGVRLASLEGGAEEAAEAVEAASDEERSQLGLDV
jgi:DNA polymerase-4